MALGQQPAAALARRDAPERQHLVLSSAIVPPP